MPHCRLAFHAIIRQSCVGFRKCHGKEPFHNQRSARRAGSPGPGPAHPHPARPDPRHPGHPPHRAYPVAPATPQRSLLAPLLAPAEWWRGANRLSMDRPGTRSTLPDPAAHLLFNHPQAALRQVVLPLQSGARRRPRHCGHLPLCHRASAAHPAQGIGAVAGLGGSISPAVGRG